EDEPDETQRDWLNTCRDGLIESLSTRPKLRTLISSPLLCALLCALYRQRNMTLPHSRRDLLEAALDLLLERWDRIRDLSVGEDLKIGREEKEVLLQRFAAAMADEQQLVVSRQVAERRFEHAM